MVRGALAVLAASGLLASVIAWVFVLINIVTPKVSPIDPVPALTVPFDRVESIVVSTADRGYIDLLLWSDGSWKNVNGGVRDFPTERVEQLLTLLEGLRIEHEARGWNEFRYGPPAMTVSLRCGEDVPESERSSSIWFGSREAQASSPRATVRIAGVPIGDEKFDRWQLVRTGPEKMEPSGAVSLAVVPEIERLVAEWLHDPKAADAPRRN